jgi:hypothetical protein
MFILIWFVLIIAILNLMGTMFDLTRSIVESDNAEVLIARILKTLVWFAIYINSLLQVLHG